MSVTLKVCENMCSCVPTWYNDMIATAEDGKCNGCLVDFGDTDIRGANSVLIPCAQSPGRVHCNAILFHIEGTCMIDFKCNQKKKGWDKSYDTIPFLMENTSDISLVKTLRQDCLKNHKRNGTICNSCKTLGEKKNIKLLICSGCKMIRYCNFTCQQQDWENHKTFCREHVKQQKKNANSVPLKRQKPKTDTCCKCLNATDKVFFDRQAPDVCSYYYCEKRVIDAPATFTLYSTECTLNGRGTGMHIIPTSYCSSRCTKRGMNFKMK